jgi:hypothetical protein
MSIFRRFAITAGTVLGVTALASAQGMMGGRPPSIPGRFSPTVGSGAVYQITAKGGEANWTYAVVGKGSVDGADGYWLEMRGDAPRGGKMVMKELMVTDQNGVEIKRMIMQAPGHPPMEMPVGMMAMGKPKGDASSGANGVQGEKLGSESVTVPAGTFDCDHYRSTAEGRTSDVWVSTKVAPYGLVKMTSPETSMVLEKVLEHETSQIQGEPQKMPMMPGMPGMPSH